MLNRAEPGDVAVVGLQTTLTEQDYQSAADLEHALDLWLTALRKALPTGAELIVVLPEHIGTWLVAADESWLTYKMPTTSLAMVWPALRQPVTFFQYWQGAAEADALSAALFRLKAPALLNDYTDVMSHLARRHQLTLVAGSIILPQPQLRGGAVVLGHGALLNTSVVFDTTGNARALVSKRFPVAAELTFLDAAHRAPTHAITTAAGNLRVMICADSWYPESWQGVRQDDLVLIPSLLQGAQTWSAPWSGYNPGPAPADVDLQDVGKIAEQAAWLRYALASRGKHARAGLNVFGRDQLWDMRSSGQTIAVLHGQPLRAQNRAQPSAAVLWIGPRDKDHE